MFTQPSYGRMGIVTLISRDQFVIDLARFGVIDQ